MGICIYLTYSDALSICYQWASVFREIDFARFDYYFKTGIINYCFNNKSYAVLQAATIR